MLKIYRASNLHGEIELEDNIKFNKMGIFDTGTFGYGDIISGNKSCETANYEFTNLDCFERYVKSVKKRDGFVEDFTFWNPKSYEMLREEFKDIKNTVDQYIKYGLNEEAILLLTHFVYISFDKTDDKVRNIFGRLPECGLYLLKPDAKITMRTEFCYNEAEVSKYEVLQSKTLGKRLVLQKFDRKI